MNGKILGAAFAALVTLPALANADPADRWRDDKSLQIHDVAGDYGFSCDAGGAGSLLVGAAVIGLVARRRK